MPKPQSSTCDDIERALPDSFVIDPEKRYLLHNRTPERICIVDDAHGEVRLAPLAQRVVRGTRLAPFAAHLVPLRQRHQLRVREYTGEQRSTFLQVLLWCAVLSLVGVVIGDILVHGTLVRVEALAVVIVVIAVVIVALASSVSRERRRRRDEEVADADEGDIAFGVGGAYYDGNETVRRTKHIFTLLVVLVIGAIVPALAIFVATDAKEFLIMEGGLRIKDGVESRFVSRIIQVVYTAVLSLFPAIMYFQFDRQRVGTIRGKWVRAIFRMDHQMRTLADVNARYGDELAEASSYSTDSVRFLGGRNSPIIVATILISLGWTLLVVQTESVDFAGATKVSVLAESADEATERANRAVDAASDTDLGARAATASSAANAAARASDAATEIAAGSTGDTVPSTPPTAPPPQPSQSAIEQNAASAAASAEEAAAAEAAVRQPFFQLLVPTPSAATMAFLGAYFFGVYLVLGGYFRGDLRPKIYNQITARLVTVVVLAYLMTVLFSDAGDHSRPLWAAAFLAGVVPVTVLQRLGLFASSVIGGNPLKRGSATSGQDLPAGWLRKAFAEPFATPRSLTQIDGIDIYESARLESEGIADIPSLARSDLVSMMINTRLPVERLVDWTDQAVLIVLLDNGHGEKPDKRVRQLRNIGIRTASSLHAVARTDDAGGTRRTVEKILAGGTPADGQSLVQWLANRIAAEPSIRRIQQWHDSELTDLDHHWPTIKAGDVDHVGASRADPSPNGGRPSRPKPRRAAPARVSPSGRRASPRGAGATRARSAGRA